jgi:hypothetical protein
LFGDWPAGQFVYLQCANHTADIARQNAGGGDRIEQRQPRVQRRRAMLRGLALQGGT